MKLPVSLYDFLYSKQKWLEAMAIFLLLSAVAFRFDHNHSSWVWSAYPFIGVLIALCVLVIAVVWIRIEKMKTQQMIDSIKSNSTDESAVLREQVDQLSLKQREVFDLITAGKSNKDILQIMVIEQSTLKSHINQIYKKLGIKSRHEARLLGNRLK